jgi:hypothetical protein
MIKTTRMNNIENPGRNQLNTIRGFSCVDYWSRMSRLAHGRYCRDMYGYTV